MREKPHVLKLINCYEHIEYGRNFINAVASIKLRNMMYMHHLKNFDVKDVQTKFGEAIFTNKKMFKTHFLREIKPGTDIRISVDCLTSRDSVKISSSDGNSTKSFLVDANEVERENGINQVEVKKKESYTIEYPV